MEGKELAAHIVAAARDAGMTLVEVSTSLGRPPKWLSGKLNKLRRGTTIADRTLARIATVLPAVAVPPVTPDPVTASEEEMATASRLRESMDARRRQLRKELEDASARASRLHRAIDSLDRILGPSAGGDAVRQTEVAS